ncbi:hypothetical protein CAPTEDRAFT_216501 [Capitella teleta]|uniref:Uncharacterized protein n=1 Tax=Capitella teleta TaxID=283909 RepID=R7TEQ9_CAPTE|nr:hypothetical protein CAPTEDRAFT_216501 [Capitella teleta]|eukprot:ELT91967.1 hypothetical protein CAPTEDRAFT_216501 [Capitella teleta]
MAEGIGDIPSVMSRPRTSDSKQMVTRFDGSDLTTTTVKQSESVISFSSKNENEEDDLDQPMTPTTSAHVVLAHERPQEEHLVNDRAPPSYLMLSLVSMLFCNPLLGAVAVWKSTKSRKAFKECKGGLARILGNEAMVVAVLAFIAGLAFWSFLVIYFWVKSIWGDDWR